MSSTRRRRRQAATWGVPSKCRGKRPGEERWVYNPKNDSAAPAFGRRVIAQRFSYQTVVWKSRQRQRRVARFRRHAALPNFSRPGESARHWERRQPGPRGRDMQNLINVRLRSRFRRALFLTRVQSSNSLPMAARRTTVSTPHRHALDHPCRSGWSTICVTQRKGQ